MKSKSWLDLKPLKTQDGNIEYFEDYYNRIKLKTEYSHIPKGVFEQWLWAHHDKEESKTNYGWFNYENIEFQICSWPTNQFSNIYILDSYREYYKLRSSYNDLNKFCCTKIDLNHWEEKGTWRTPPIILDIMSLNKEIPKWCELIPPFQLVEGHSRLGYLHSMVTIDKLGKEKIAPKHDIFLMKINRNNV